MDESLKIGQNFVSGSFQLLVGKVVSTVLLAVGTIILGYLFVHEGDYGLYSIAMIPATTILLFQDWGVGSALTRFCAQERAANNELQLRKTIIAGFTFELITGIVLTLVSILAANFIALSLFGKPESAILIVIGSITVLSTAVMGAATNVFIGLDKMKISAIVMICFAFVQTTLSPLLVFMKMGALGAVLGYTIGSGIASIIATAFLFFAILKDLPKVKITLADISQTLKPLLYFGVPLATATILSGLLVQFNSFMMASYVNTTMIGNYKIASNFAILLTFFTYPITTVLFPTFSKIDPDKNSETFKKVFSSSVKYSSFLLLPATVLMILMSSTIIGTLYQQRWSYAPPFLALGVISNLLIIFGSLSVSGVLAATGQTKLLMKLSILGLIIGIPIGFIFIPTYGIIGMLIGSFLALIPSTLIALHVVWKRYGAKIDFILMSKIIVTCLLAAVPAYFLGLLGMPEWFKLVSGVIVFTAVYLISSVLVGVIREADINNLRIMTSGLGPVSKILEIPLILMEKSIKTRNFVAPKYKQKTTDLAL